MRSLSKTGYRLLFAAIVVVSLASLGLAYGTSSVSETADRIEQGAENPDETVAPPTDDVTVIATDSNVWLRDGGDGPRANAELIAFDPDGSVRYYDDTYDRYWDVDPVPNSSATVVYSASIHLSEKQCGAQTVCTRNFVETANLTTGETERLFERITPGKHSTRWHDADRINDTHYAVADIARDRVFVVNTETGLVTWEWDALSDYQPSSGGPYPEDWTHLNDVEVLDDGRLMVSLRNHDQVVFLDPGEGLQADWTLGEEDTYDVLYEQHNPDYIPEADGGPAVVIGDSENNRVVEYQREGGEWVRSWTWQDSRMQWPRDADRLPNGNTLVTDSNGNRVIEVNPAGEIVWEIEVAFPYEAERFGTGDESADGPSARQAGLESRTPDEAAVEANDPADRAWLTVRGLLPGNLANAFAYVLPAWMGLLEALIAAALALTLLAWAAAELRWMNLRARLRSPITFSRKGEP